MSLHLFASVSRFSLGLGVILGTYENSNPVHKPEGIAISKITTDVQCCYQDDRAGKVLN